MPLNQSGRPPRRARLAIHTVGKAFALAWRATPYLTTSNAVITVMQGILPAATLYLSKLIVDSAVTASQVRSRASAYHVIMLAVCWIGVQLLASLLSTLTQLVSNLQRNLISNYINVQLIEKANQLDLSYFENAEFYDKLENARREAGYRPAQMVDQLTGLLRNVVTLISVIGVLFAQLPWLVLIVAVISIPMFLFQAKYSRQFYSLVTTRAPEQRKLNYLSWLLTTDGPVKELHIFGLHNSLIERYRALFAKFYCENRALNLRKTRSLFAIGALSVLVFGATFVYVLLEVIAGRTTIGGLTLYYQAFQQSQQNVTHLLSGTNGLYENGLFLSNLFTFLAFAPRLSVNPNPIPMPDTLCDGIVLEHVSFKYPDTEEWVLEDVSFVLRPGETIALVGANGAGKTTLVKLLTRLYDPTEGRITFGGIDLRAFDPAALRSRIAVVFQDYVKYQMTAGENIGFGRVEAINDTARIERAAVSAGVDKLVAGLPNGYDTPLGRWFADGQELSVGQWQKIALARAFMRDADLLILDEPTASLDAYSEYEIFQTFSELTAGKVAVVISHRFSTVRMADRIIVIENGRVVEQGTHEALLIKGGRYAELFEFQAISYR